MRVVITKQDNKVAFVGKVENFEGLKKIIRRLQEEDKKYGVNNAYNVSNFSELIKKDLLTLEKQRLNRILDQYGYINLGDVQYYASQNDQEAQALLGWYQAYDDGIWNWIDNTLPNYQTLDELLNLDLKAIEEDIFNQSVQKASLP